MTTRLRSLEFTPRMPSGWGTSSLNFGSVITLVLGPNGSGKTPLLKGIPFALGHPIKLPPDIIKHCRSVLLSIEAAGVEHTIERNTDGDFSVVVTTEGATREFAGEKEYSPWIISLLGIPERHLADREGGVVPPYMSVLAPLFWVDQDLGWRNLYSPLVTHNFVKDQAEEVARWILAIPARNRAVSKEEFVKTKERLASVEEQVAIKRATVSSLRRELGSYLSPDGREQLVARKEAVVAQLEAHTSVLDILSRTDLSVNERLDEHTAKRNVASFAFESAERRLGELQRLGQELRTEVQILETNEIAADAFRTLCGNEACQFFRRPEESYGRRLLYLKDQLKDFESSFSAVDDEVSVLRNELSIREKDYQLALQQKQSVIRKSQAGQIAPIIDAITKEMSEINQRLDQIERIVTEQKRLDALVNLALKLESEVNDLRPTRGTGGEQGRLVEARNELGRSTADWLGTLRTQNVSSRVRIDENLRLHIGDETFTEGSSFSGSTRTRIVLAYHAAMAETSLKLHGNHPHFLVLDAPKQHELHAADLRAFVVRFKEVVSAYSTPIQLIIGATENSIIDERGAEAVWRPRFGTRAKPRFFGSASDLVESQD